jgi:hypothetical protein
VKALGPILPIEVGDLRHLFDLAVDSPTVCSGSFENDDVDLLRKIAVLINVDPEGITPEDFITNYPHTYRPTGVGFGRQGLWIKALGQPYQRRAEFEPIDEWNARIVRESEGRPCGRGEYRRECGLPEDDPKHTASEVTKHREALKAATSD